MKVPPRVFPSTEPPSQRNRTPAVVDRAVNRNRQRLMVQERLSLARSAFYSSFVLSEPVRSHNLRRRAGFESEPWSLSVPPLRGRNADAATLRPPAPV